MNPLREELSKYIRSVDDCLYSTKFNVLVLITSECRFVQFFTLQAGINNELRQSTTDE